MTQTETGFQDWQRATRVSGKQLYFINQVVSSSFFTYPFYCGNYGYLILGLAGTNLVNHYRITVDWYLESALTHYVGTSEFVSTPGNGNAIKFVCVTEYAVVGIYNIEATADAVVPLSVYGSNADHNNLTTDERSVPFLDIHENIAAGASVTVTCKSTYSGPAMLAVRRGSDSNWTVLITYWDYSSASWVHLLEYVPSSAETTIIKPIRLPPAPTRLQMSNTGTTTVFCDATIVIGDY